MKRIFFILGALALVGLSSCVDRLENNPNYNPDTKEVLSNFIFNVATNDSPSTKMTGGAVQEDVQGAGDFRGIDHGHIIALTLGNTNKTAVGDETSGNGGMRKVFVLNDIVNAGALSGPGQTGENVTHSHRVLELNVPTGVNNIIFYGKAMRDNRTDDELGKIDYTISTTSLADTRIELVPRLTQSELFSSTQNLIAKVLTNILTNPVIDYNSQTIRWKDFATYSNGQFTPTNASPLSDIVGSVFCNFVNIPLGSVRAGAGQSVVRMVGDMAVSLGQVARAVPTEPEEVKAAEMAREIIKEMDRYFYITTLKAGNTAVPDSYEDAFNPLWTQENENAPKVYDFSYVNTDAEQVRWRMVGDIKQETGENGYSGSLEAIRFFPTYFNMPAGVAQLLINTETLAVSYSNTPGAFNGTGVDINKVMYPTELCYFGNSPIRVSNDVIKAKDFPDGSGSGSGEWLASGSWPNNGWGNRGGEVLSTTKSIAMCDNVNYGSALLEVTVGYANISDQHPLVDNCGNVPNTTNGPGAFFPDETPKINYSEAPDNLFTLTGVLIGGQYKTMGWNYIRKEETGNSNTFVVYDRIIDPFTGAKGSQQTGINVKGGSAVSNPNYTLVWDNYNPDENAQDEVLVALEFVNNSNTDFWGEHNIIRKGGTFYLLGRLTIPSETNSTFEWPTDLDANDLYALPPYDANGNTIKTERVFVQDYITKADFKIGPTSLRHAYLTVPDLRSSQLSLGLSVNLKWRNGRTYTYILGGN